MYPYITENNLNLPQSYNYTAFGGVAFLQAYLSTRKALFTFLCEPAQNQGKNMEQRELESVNDYILESCKNEKMLKLVIKTFEVNKRLYMSYDKGVSRFSNEEILKPDKMSSYTHIDNYLCFAKALCAFFAQTHNLLYLNTLLKLNDTLLSLTKGNSSLSQSLNECGNSAQSFTSSKLPSPRFAQHSNLSQDTRIADSKNLESNKDTLLNIQYDKEFATQLTATGGGIMPYLAKSVQCEIEGVNMIAQKAGLKSFVDSANSTNTQNPTTQTQSQAELAGLEASLSTLQVIIDSIKDYEYKDTPLDFSSINAPAKCVEIESSFAMIYALSSRSNIYFQAMLHCGIAPSHIVILGNALEAQQVISQIQNLGISTHCIDTQDINDEAVFSYVKSLPQKYVIYSGYGGGILESKYFHISKHFIHIHAGKLPQYKGSTTCYYSLLEEGEICSTAMFLNDGLDCGDMLGFFSLSSKQLCEFANTDIDTTLEPYIRSQALVKVLLEYKQNGAFSLTSQNRKEGETYYRIHPTLKHLALFSCFGNGDISANGGTQ